VIAEKRLAPQDWMTASATRSVMEALSRNGTTPRFVGGCVRDALLGRPVKDIDIATPDIPETVIEKLAAADLKSVPTGLKHGTITAIADGLPFEVTTLRRDIETDGRHAKVIFTDNWSEDAARRDLTINAIYCDGDGNLLDPVSGLADLRDRKLRFVGEASERIAEDVLRILRFFRFFAHYGEGQIDAAGYTACHDQAHLLPTLSAERISAELLRLLAAVDPVPTLDLMTRSGVLAQVLPTARPGDLLASLVRLEQTCEAVDPLRRLYALCSPDRPQARMLADQLRLSANQKQRLMDMAARQPELEPATNSEDLRKALYLRGKPVILDQLFLNQADSAEDNAAWQGLQDRVDQWQPVTLPVQGQDVLDRGLQPGPEVGRVIKEIESWWIEGDFQADRSACLQQLEKLISQP
jgi:poly(A) polymerase